MKNNFVDIFIKYLKLINAKVTKTSAHNYLTQHPDQGTMLAYTDALSHFKIENAAAKITSEDLMDIPTPVITYTELDGGIFTIIKQVKNDTLIWFHQNKGWIKSPLSEFLQNWSGIVLLAETNKNSGEKDYTRKRYQEIIKGIRIPLALCLIGLLIISIFFLDLNSSFVWPLLILKTSGMVFSSLLFIKSVNGSNSLVAKLCSSGSKIDCNTIFDSPAAQINSWFSWSDAGFLYFFGSFFSLLFCLASNEAMQTFLTIQGVFSVTAIMFSMYSLYYQSVKAKVWCTLCLGVVATFLLEAIVIFFYLSNNDFSIGSLGLTKITLGFFIPISFLLLFKNMAINASESEKIKLELKRIKTNPKIFEALMAGQRNMPEILEQMHVVLLGSSEAENTITFVSNPSCAPCAKMHLKIEQLLRENDSSINCQVIFLSDTDANDPGGQFVRKLFSIPAQLRAKAIEEWYQKNDKNFELWNRTYEIYHELNSAIKIQEEHLEWAKKADIKVTPTLFINGKLVPEFIEVKDLAIHLSQVIRTSPTYGFADQNI